jgi:hypothetical protein
MFGSNKTPQKLVHLPRQQHPQTPQQSPAQRNPDLQLPRGECRYILPDVETDGSRQRCSCASFSLNQSVPGSLCGCGHQAWHHVTEPVGNYVPLDEHLALIEKVRKLEETTRRLQEELVRERKERERGHRDVHGALRGSYQNMGQLKYYMDEKIERLRMAVDDRMSKGFEELDEALDKAHDASQTAEQLGTRVATMDEAIMQLEERLDLGRFPSRSLTPVKEAGPIPRTSSDARKPPERPAPDLPIRTHPKTVDVWDARVILVPRRFQQFAFNPDGLAYRRCQSRGFHQDLHLPNRNSESFIKAVEERFTGILRGRLWMPLQCLKSSDMSLNQLSPPEIDPKLWNYDFLEAQCMAYDKQQGGDVIFIALQTELLSWKEIQSLPRSFGSDESCWAHSDELDEKTSKEDMAMMDYSMDIEASRPTTGVSHADTHVSDPTPYELASPPPYNYPGRGFSSPPEANAASSPASGLEVLANASALVHSSGPPSISDRSISTMGSIDSTLITARTGSSSGSMLDVSEYDQHRDKRTKHTALRPHPVSGPASPSHQHGTPPNPPQIIYAGRTKRKAPQGKQKEPMDWRPSEMNIKNPVKGLLHRRSNHDPISDKRPHTSSGASTTQSMESTEQS